MTDESDTRVFRDRISEIVWERMLNGQTSTGYAPAWIAEAADAIWDEFSCRGCGYGIADLGVYFRQCNDCAPRLKAEECR